MSTTEMKLLSNYLEKMILWTKSQILANRKGGSGKQSGVKVVHSTLLIGFINHSDVHLLEMLTTQEQKC